MKISMKNVLSEDAKNLYVFLVKILGVDLDLEDYDESSGEIMFRFKMDWSTYHTLYERWDYINDELENWKLCIIHVNERKRNTDYEVKATFKHKTKYGRE